MERAPGLFQARLGEARPFGRGFLIVSALYLGRGRFESVPSFPLCSLWGLMQTRGSLRFQEDMSSVLMEPKHLW